MSNEFIETAEQREQLRRALEELKHIDGPLMKAMQVAQDIYGYLPYEVQVRIAEALDVPLEEVYGIATFYAQFNLNPKGKHSVGVCLGTACYVKGSGKIIEKVEEILKLQPGQTTEDRKFTLMATRCIGCCGLAPVMTVDDDVYGNLVPENIEGILAKYND